MEDVKLRLDAWRHAERRRDVLAVGTLEWRDAEEKARNAAKLFHAEVAQVSARYDEEDSQRRKPWTAPLDRRVTAEGNSMADASLDGWPQK